MANNDTDLDLQEDNKEPQTPFGGWASAPPRSDDEAGPSGPKAVITSEDGSQRTASPEELSAPKFNGIPSQPAGQKPAEPAIRSFSATFGVALPPMAGASAPKAEESRPEPQPAPAGAMTFSGTPHLVQFAAVKDTQLFAPPGAQTSMQASPSLPEPAQGPDPFAWSPEEVPVASTEPRRQPGGDSWIGAVDTSYGNTASPFLEPQLDAPAPEAEQEAPIVNPFITGQPAWQAPSLEDFTASEPEATEEEEEPVEQQADKAEPASPSPFNFVAYDSQPVEQNSPLEVQAAPSAASAPFEETPLFEEAPLPVETAQSDTSAAPVEAAADGLMPVQPEPEPEPEQQAAAPAGDIFAPATLNAEVEPQPQAETPFFAQPAEIAAPSAPTVTSASDIFAPVNESPEMAQPASPPLFTEMPLTEMPVEGAPMPLEPAATASNLFAEAELDMDITQAEQEGEPFAHAAAAEADAAPAAFPAESRAEPSNIFAEDYLPESQAAPEAPQDITQNSTNAGHMTPQTQPFEDLPEQQELPPAEEASFNHMANPTVSAVNLRHLTADAVQHILQEHALWLSSGGRNGRRANFRNANLRGVNLSQSHLAEASLRGADLSGSNLSGSDLHGADLSEAFLSHADLRSTNLAAAIVTHVDMRTAAFEGAVMQGADFSGSSLAGANLAGLDFAGAVMQDTDLNGANLSQANLSGTNLRGAHLINANLSYASLASANCRDVQFNGAILDYANLEGASLKNARMQGASLIGIDITAAEETSDEHRHESLQSERELLQQEWQKLQALESQIQQLQGQMQQREMALQSDRSQVERAKRELRTEYEGMEQLMEKAHQVMRHHRLHDRQFKYYGVTWFIFTILAFVSVMLFVRALEIANLDWLSVALVLGGCTLILGLFIATTVRRIRLSNNLKRLLDVYDQLFPRTDNSGQ